MVSFFRNFNQTVAELNLETSSCHGHTIFTSTTTDKRQERLYSQHTPPPFCSKDLRNLLIFISSSNIRTSALHHSGSEQIFKYFVYAVYSVYGYTDNNAHFNLESGLKSERLSTLHMNTTASIIFNINVRGSGLSPG